MFKEKEKDKKVTEEETPESTTERALSHQGRVRKSVIVKKKAVPTARHISTIDLLVKTSAKPEDKILAKNTRLKKHDLHHIERKLSTQRSVDTFGEETDSHLQVQQDPRTERFVQGSSMI